MHVVEHNANSSVALATASVRPVDVDSDIGHDRVLLVSSAAAVTLLGNWSHDTFVTWSCSLVELTTRLTKTFHTCFGCQSQTTNASFSEKGSRSSTSLHPSSCSALTITGCIRTTLTLAYVIWLLSVCRSQRDPTILSTHLTPVFPDLATSQTLEALEDNDIGNCSFSLANLAGKADIFLAGHVLGYVGKMILFRDIGFSWLISICWEFTEILYAPILPNFTECWWDAVMFDVVGCNAIGILIGSWIVSKLNVAFLDWYKLPQTPSWSLLLSHGFNVCILLFFTNLAELNSFTMKRVFGVHKNHPLNVMRLLFHSYMAYPVITDYRRFLRGQLASSDIAIQFWLYLAAVILELYAVLCHGSLLGVESAPVVALWLSMLLFGSIVYVVLSTSRDYLCQSPKAIIDK